MHLSQYIVENIEPILQEFEEFARTHTIRGESMDVVALRDRGYPLRSTHHYILWSVLTPVRQYWFPGPRLSIVPAGPLAGVMNALLMTAQYRPAETRQAT